MFETVSFHLVKPCNMSCKFCYATYNSFNVGKQLSLHDAKIIVTKLKMAGLQKITFAGGEPMLYKHLDELIRFSKHLGLVTSIITNGSMLDEQWLKDMRPYLDWLGISIDSLSPSTNVKIGRVTRHQKAMNYYALIDLINKYHYKLKINTVVNKFNEDERMLDFIDWSGTTRWKVFDALKVEGQNEEEFHNIYSNKYREFVERNKHSSMVLENNDLMTASYLLIDPLGRFYENWGTDNRKSDSLVNHTVEDCLSQIKLDRSKFIERGGIYKW